VVRETGSTNADLMARAAYERPALLTPNTRAPAAARPRAQLSAPRRLAAFSLAWKFALAPQGLLGLPLAVGVALAEALVALEVPVQLKWPNDLLKDGDKLAGILIETQAAAGGGTWAVIGIGINLLMPGDMQARIGRPAAAAPWLARMDRDALVAALLGKLAASLDQFAAHGFGAFRARWDALHAWRGRQVAILDQGALLQHGLAVGVDERGCLLLDTAGGRVALLAGDVSLRLKED
jgi:BirA family biotin operon repressor/biotin-[acetyl-CoA-carboxylase] ligase